MKKIFSLSYLFLFGIYLYAQKQPQLSATYLYTNIDIEEKIDVRLLINGREALSTFKNTKTDTTFVNEVEEINIKREANDSIGRLYYQSIEKKQLVFRDFILIDNVFKPVIVEEDIPAFNWQFTNETKNIGKFSCNLAKSNFRGRNYNVWYTMDIPTSFGPWKFYGLPGLIVEANSDDNSVSFILKKVITVDKTKIDIPSQGDKITFKEYVEFKNNVVEEFVKNLKAKLPRGAVVNFKSVDHNLEKSFE
jgi:GLPGLI family protein